MTTAVMMCLRYWSILCFGVGKNRLQERVLGFLDGSKTLIIGLLDVFVMCGQCSKDHIELMCEGVVLFYRDIAMLLDISFGIVFLVVSSWDRHHHKEHISELLFCE